MGASVEHRDFYEEEARVGRRKPQLANSERGRLRATFIRELLAEGRSSVIDFGAGPGLEGPVFKAEGIHYCGVDLAVGNAVLAADSEVAVVPASLGALPLRAGVFDAGWSMSVIMHFSDTDAGAALVEMATVLKPGAPMIIGTWGSADSRHVVDDQDLPGVRRHFHLRSLQANADLADAVAQVEAAEALDLGPADWEYHVLRLRIEV